MKILISGATGLLGKQLVNSLQKEGHSIAIFTRSPDKLKGRNVAAYKWLPDQETPPAAAFDGVDVVIHLAGEPIAAGRWTEEQKRRIRDSRVLSTRNLVNAMRELATRPKALICASAIGFYGDRGDEKLTEQSNHGTGFLADVSQEWEAEAQAATTFGLRVVQVRIGVVLAKDGGALEQMLPIFKLGLGGSLGDGQQWFPWIHITDVVGIFEHAIFNDSIAGPINAVAPASATNAEFTNALSLALKRPAWFAVPRFALRLGLGEMADLLLGSSRVIPEYAVSTGYKFKFPSLSLALENLFSATTSDTNA